MFNNLRKLTGSLRTLRVLFKEVLQQTSLEIADELADSYRQGKSLMLVMGHSRHDTFPGENKTAFRWVLVKSDYWRDPDWRPAHVVKVVTAMPPTTEHGPN